MKLNDFTANFKMVNGKSVVDVLMTRDGVETYRRIPLVEFVNLIARRTVIQEEVSSYDYGSTLDIRGNVLYTCSNTKGDLGVVLEVPKGRHFFSAFDKSYMLPFPRLIIALALSKDGARKFFKIFSSKDLSKNSTLYLYPFGNVSKTGDVCMGSTSYDVDSAKNATFSDVQKVVDAFFSGKTSGHFYTAGATVGVCMELPDFVNYVNSLKEFPEDILVESSIFTLEGLYKELYSCIEK